MFSSTQDDANAFCISQEIIIVKGNLKAKVGNERDGEIFGKFRLGSLKQRRGKLVQWWMANCQVITNSWFQDQCWHGEAQKEKNPPKNKQKNKHQKTTTKTDQLYNYQQQIKKYGLTLQNISMCPVLKQSLSTDMCKLRVKRRILKQIKVAPKFQYNRLWNDPNLKEKYMGICEKADTKEKKGRWRLEVGHFKKIFSKICSRDDPKGKETKKKVNGRQTKFSTWLKSDTINANTRNRI